MSHSEFSVYVAYDHDKFNYSRCRSIIKVNNSFDTILRGTFVPSCLNSLIGSENLWKMWKIPVRTYWESYFDLWPFFIKSWPVKLQGDKGPPVQIDKWVISNFLSTLPKIMTNINPDFVLSEKWMTHFIPCLGGRSSPHAWIC